MNIHCKYDELVKCSALKPHPKNRNKHPDEQIDRLAKILKYQGIRAPIVVSKRSGKIVKGHGTLQAIKKNGWEQAPIVVQDFEDDDQEWLFVQSDNAIAMWAELDLKGINADLSELGPFDIDLIGIKDFEVEPLDKLLGDDDAVPDVKPTDIKLGDLFVLGDHRLLCGDSTDAAQVERLMNNEKASLLCWDPPFNVGFDYQGAYKNQDSKTDEEYGNFLNTCLSNWNSHCCKEHWAFVWQGMRNVKNFNIWFKNYDWRLISVVKNFVQARPTWLNWATDPVIAWTSSDKKQNISKRDWFLSNTANTKQTPDRIISGNHPCPRQIDVCEYFIQWCDQSDIVMDLTLGSGTTLIACEKTNRKCFGMELDPQYCQVIIDRWEQYTGKKAVKDAGGTTT